MSYALRNTLILLATLVLMAGGGWFYLTWSMESEISDQETRISRSESELIQLSTKASDYLLVQEQHMTLKYQAEHATKELLVDNSVATIFDYLRQINQGPAYTVMNFSLQDSVLNADHGIVQIRLDGSGSYANFYNFLVILEQSKPIARVTNIRLAPTQDVMKLNDIQFEMNVQFYYARGTTKSTPELLINTSIPQRLYNPLYPLVHEIPANDNNLPNIDESRLVGLTSNGAYIINQSGEFMFLPVGARVYLGRLQSVNPQTNSATFALNRGGIGDRIVLRISQR
jgi:Tfp pilus assembly protein PilO